VIVLVFPGYGDCTGGVEGDDGGFAVMYGSSISRVTNSICDGVSFSEIR